MELARTGKIQAVTCSELMDELAEKLELKYGFTSEQSAETVARHLSFLRLVRIQNTLEAVPRDPDDDAVIECALEGKATHVISGDKDLLDLKKFRNIEIVRASEFLEIMAKQS